MSRNSVSRLPLARMRDITCDLFCAVKTSGITCDRFASAPALVPWRLRTPYAEAVKEGTRERHQGRGTLDMLYVNGDVANTSGAAGESAGLIHEIKPVREIIDDTIASFWREIDRLAALRPGVQRRAG